MLLPESGILPNHFQFPLHREGLFNIDGIVALLLALDPFSSLFIGKDSSTRGSVMLPARRLPFSSLFIGKDSSTGFSGLRTSPRFSLSVPSSSGRTLQQRNWTRALRIAGFSVPSSSGRTLQLIKDTTSGSRSTFSVPSSSGRTLQRGTGPDSLAHFIVFSSLFIGKDSSTNTVGWMQSGNKFLSVPSSSGRTLQRIGGMQ